MDYEINNDTLAILSVHENKSKIVENHQNYELDYDTYEVVEHSCEYFGSTLSGRQIGTKNLIGVTHKSPIIIEESNNMIFFPISSPFRDKCSWVSFNNIKTYYRGEDKNTSIIEFKNGEKIVLPISYGSLTNQILRASRLMVVLLERKQKSIEKY